MGTTRRQVTDMAIRRRCGRAKQFLAAAEAREIIKRNPFRGIKCGMVANRDRLYFVQRDDIQAVIEACPDAEWRLIFALARYGGLRCPSEILLLTWGDIDWERQRFTVHSPKTAHQGKCSRVLPLFPELVPYLQDCFDQAEPGVPHVITRYRDSRQNLGTQARRIIKRAGLNPWPKTFQNCRSSRETELVEDFPLQTVTAWLGNSPQIAARHYLQVREEHFQKALQFPVQQTAVRARTTASGSRSPNENSDVCGSMQEETALCKNTGPHPPPRLGLEPRT